jgi:hypothetical protein
VRNEDDEHFVFVEDTTVNKNIFRYLAQAAAKTDKKALNTLENSRSFHSE